MAIDAHAADDDPCQPMQIRLKLNVPECMPTTFEDAQDRSRWLDKWTFMHTNEGIHPYKVMDDLTFVGVPLFLAGIIAKGEKKAFRQNDGTQHVLVTDFHTHIDDYLQYFGPTMTIGLKVGGVEGRSDWGRLLASVAMSYALEAIMVNGIKYTAREQRPDGTSHNAWPSGHTATSFTGATILHHEYGLTRSPWYSVAGYGVATTTAILRILNNRHWVSDILSGAGIGIMSTEIGYALSDIIFKGKGLLRNNKDSIASIISHPSFFAISMGIGFGTKHLDFKLPSGDLPLKFQSSTMVGIEGAYYINKYLGFGARLRLNSSPISGWNSVIDHARGDFGRLLRNMDTGELRKLDGIVFTDGERQPWYEIESDHLTEAAADIGVYANYPLSRHFAIGAKLLGGRSFMQELNLKAHYQGEKKEVISATGLNSSISPIESIDIATITDADGNPQTYESSWDYFMLNANNTWHIGTGLSATYAYKNNFSFRAFCEYDFTHKTYTLNYSPGEFLRDAAPALYDIAATTPALTFAMPQQQKLRKPRHTIILGASVAVSF